MSDKRAIGGEAFHRANLATTFLNFGISGLVGLWFTPYLVHTLGIAAYGLIPLATTAVSYFSLISQALSASLSRNFSIAVGSGDQGKANEVFGMSVSAALRLCAILLPLLAAFTLAAPLLFDTPLGMAAETRLMFAVVSAAFLTSLISTCYSAVAFSCNRIYLNNLAALIQSLGRVGLTVLLFVLLSASIGYAALAIFSSSVLSLLLNVAFAKRSLSWLKLSNFRGNQGELRQLYRTSSHQLVMQLGTVLVMSCEIVLVNKLYGHGHTGRYAAVMQWLLVVRNAATALVVMFVPTILAYYARGEIAQMVVLVKRAMRWTGVCIALPVGYLCGLSPLVLNVWLGHDFVDLWPILCVQLLPLVVISSVVPLYTVSLAADRVLPSALMQLVTGASAIVLTIVIVTQTGAGMVAVPLCVGWLFFAKEVLFMPLYVAGNIRVAAATFYSPLLPGIAVLAFTAIASWIAGRIFLPHSYLHLVLIGMGISIVHALAAFVLIGAKDRRMLLAKVVGKRFDPSCSYPTSRDAQERYGN